MDAFIRVQLEGKDCLLGMCLHCKRVWCAGAELNEPTACYTLAGKLNEQCPGKSIYGTVRRTYCATLAPITDDERAKQISAWFACSAENAAEFLRQLLATEQRY